MAAAAAVYRWAGARYIVSDETDEIESKRKYIFYAKFHVYSKGIHFAV